MPTPTAPNWPGCWTVPGRVTRSPSGSLTAPAARRLGRSLKHLIETVNHFSQSGVGFRSLKENIDTTTATGKLIFHIFASFAEFERDMIRERTMAGLAASRARGRVGGRRKGLGPELLRKAPAAQTLYEAKNISVDEIARQLGISKGSLYKLLRHQGLQIGTTQTSVLSKKPS